MNRPLILITNDDGIESPGLHVMAEAVADLGELLIMAPQTQQTGAGRSYPKNVDKTIHSTQIPLGEQPHPAHTAQVSPAQAVSLAVVELASRPIDLCLSGINYGENIGTGVTISGTVGAALEAACYNIPALAVSLETPQEYHLNHSDQVDFSVAAHFTRLFAKMILAKNLPSGVDLLKVDVPASATPQTEWRMGRVSRQRYYQTIPNKHLAPQHSTIPGLSYQIQLDHDTLKPDTDVYIFSVDRQVAVVPMTIDLTAQVTLQDVAAFFQTP